MTKTELLKRLKGAEQGYAIKNENPNVDALRIAWILIERMSDEEVEAVEIEKKPMTASEKALKARLMNGKRDT